MLILCKRQIIQIGKACDRNCLVRHCCFKMDTSTKLTARFRFEMLHLKILRNIVLIVCTFYEYNRNQSGSFVYVGTISAVSRKPSGFAGLLQDHLINPKWKLFKCLANEVYEM